MNRYPLLILLLILVMAFSDKVKKNDFEKAHVMLKNEFGLNSKNACVFLIHNGVCKSGLCGSRLNRFLAERLPRLNKDTFVFIVVSMDTNLADTLQLFDKKIVLESQANTLTKYGIYNLEDKAFKLSDFKIIRKTILRKDAKFNHWF